VSPIPETRLSLIVRLSDPDDVEAWDEFVAIYGPLVHRLARHRGLQHSDAEDLVQEVLLAVSRAVDSWRPDPGRAKFRTWLFRIARNLTINFLSRPKHRGIGSGDTNVHALLQQQCDPNGEKSKLFELEYQRGVFRWAAEQVRRQVKQQTWRAFWLSGVQERPIAEVAAQLEMTVGSVYIARSRVMVRLQTAVRQVQENES
jgi:RNA polymerase sigma factor (sigma-70 family)